MFIYYRLYSEYCWQQFVATLFYTFLDKKWNYLLKQQPFYKQHPFHQHKAHLLFKNRIIKQNQIISPRRGY